VLRYIGKRVFSGVITILVLITLTFFMMHFIPGSPFVKGEQKMPPEVLQRIKEKYGLDQPLYVQYLTYLKNIAKGDFGISFKKAGTTVNDIIDRGFPVSARVGLVAIAVSVLIGLALGILSAVKRASIFDGASMVFATVGISVPTFVTAVLLLYLFAGILKVLPTYGLASWKHYILPVTCLSFSPIAYIARMTRSSMLDVMQQDYIRTARAKGVREFFVIVKHGLRNAILPVVTYLGTLVAALLTGSFVIERLYAIPGIGKYYVESIGARDYNVILGMTVFFGIFVVACNIVVDILYGIIDPRVKMAEK
jgi:oligopeptide transport system permease protein